MFIDLDIAVPTNIGATVPTPRSIKVTWNRSTSPGITRYLISYTTSASYTSGGSVTVNGASTTSHFLTNLEESTLYVITVQAATNSRISATSNEVSITTLADGK